MMDHDAEKAAMRSRVDLVTAYHAPSSQEIIDAHQSLRISAAAFMNRLLDICPASPELDAALSKADEALMQANAAVARHQRVG